MCIVHLNFRPYICGDTSNAFAHRAGEPQETICRFVWPREREREILLLQLQSVLMLKNSLSVLERHVQSFDMSMDLQLGTRGGK